MVEPAADATVTISGEGDCEALSVVVESDGDANVEYEISNACHVESVRAVDAFREPTGTLGDPTRPPAHTVQTSGRASPTSGQQCDWVHSSQTVQDVANVDIAKHRLNTYRCWDGHETSMVKWTARSYTGVPWNHASGRPDIVLFDSDWGATASAQSSGKFHTDWVWCNVKSRWQGIELRNTHVSYPNGGYRVTFWQNGSCPGTHIATGVKADSKAEW
ncbi:MAG: hypothetical protein Q3979_05665 [Actinomycetaceae bacterium]|nr:hypothetical protein [Actinomycetaceae bacterium]